jgi:hypothetical protein
MRNDHHCVFLIFCGIIITATFDAPWQKQAPVVEPPALSPGIRLMQSIPPWTTVFHPGMAAFCMNRKKDLGR